MGFKSHSSCELARPPSASDDFPGWVVSGTAPDVRYRVPFLFAAHGRAYLRQYEQESGVWFLDARRPTHHPRALADWYTPEGLAVTGEMILEPYAIKRATHPIGEDEGCWLEPDDVLIQRANSLEYLGATAVFDGEPQTYVYPNLMTRVRASDSGLRRYLWRYLNSSFAQACFRSNATGTAGNMPKINGRIVRATPVAVPPHAELSVIASTLTAVLDLIRQYEKSAQAQLTRLNTLDQALLAKAFRGELVPQDPSDEPASVLLERLRAEREASGGKPARGRKTKGAAKAAKASRR